MNPEDEGTWMKGAVVTAAIREYEQIMQAEAPRLLSVLRSEHAAAGVEALENAVLTFQDQAARYIEDSAPTGEREQYVDEALINFFTALGAEPDAGGYTIRRAGPKPIRLIKVDDGRWIVEGDPR